jgi:NADPH-dependent 2,4-dienoyl-CoA reductase/sulfur reductase-like enzyme
MITSHREAGSPAGKPDRIVILGGGAAGFAAAEMLWCEGFPGSLTSDAEPILDEVMAELELLRDEELGRCRTTGPERRAQHAGPPQEV